MTNTINMEDMRHINLFEKITKIQTRLYFHYNRTIYFCVPEKFLGKAIGQKGKNIRKIGLLLKKRVKIISQPKDINDIEKFIKAIVEPINFKSVEVTEDEIIITAGNKQNKASLLGRNKTRLSEMQKIIRNFFEKDLRIK
jgi:NusA-like KH domain protein